MTTHIQLPLIGKVKNPSGWAIGLIAAGVLAIGSTTYLLVNQASPKLDIAELTVPVETKNVTLRITASGKIVQFKVLTLAPKHLGNW